MEDKGTKDIKIGSVLLNKESLKIKTQYNGELFTMNYPTPAEKANIENIIAKQLGGLNRNAYPEEHLFLIEATAYVNALIISEESPDWFKSAWTCYDEKLIATLYSEYLSFRDRFRKKFEDSKLQGNSTK